MRWTRPSQGEPRGAAPGSAAAESPHGTGCPRNVKITLMVLVLFFVGEYILLPELASARREFHQLSHLNFLWLILGALLEVAALVAYAELTRTVLSPGAPDRFRIFRINMWALAISHTLPGGTVPGTAASYRLLTESDVSGSTAAFGLATQGIGSAVVLNLIFWLSLLISIPLQGYNPLYGFAAILGVLLLAIFAGVVFLLTRGEKQAGVFVKKVADRLPFVRAETVTSLVQKVADRMKILFTSSELLMKAGIWAAANWLLDAASLWVFLLAFGARVSPIDVLVALRAGQHPRRHPADPERPRRDRADDHRRAEGLRRPERRRRGRRPQLAPGQLLAAHPLRRRRPTSRCASGTRGRRQGQGDHALTARLTRRRPSVTARWVAGAAGPPRAARGPRRPRGDVEGERRLSRDVGGIVRRARRPGRRPGGSGPGSSTREVARALGRGIEQIVLLGAGYDGRALRFGGGAVRWFEVDLPAPQADKRRRLRRARPRRRPGRLRRPRPRRRGDLGGALERPGTTPTRRRSSSAKACWPT